ncbi:MAG: hypothetical protein IJ485_06900 [Lachnospiraceae bacterium]|nr:hypothetical protein [Lachnospiraceae bacterium]
MNTKHLFNIKKCNTYFNSRHHRLIKLVAISLLAFCLTGCGKSQALDEYKENVETFASNISEINDNINNIDISSQTRVSDFLYYIDALNEEFIWFAELEVPEQFASIEALADDAEMYMTEAVSLYHRAFETEPLDTALLDTANENYKRANTRIDYIAAILQGKTPEGDGVSVEYIEENLDEEPDLESYE